MKLFPVCFWLFLKTFPQDDTGRARLQITCRLAREVEIEVSAVCKRKAFFLPPLLCYHLIQFTLYFEALV